MTVLHNDIVVTSSRCRRLVFAFLCWCAGWAGVLSPSASANSAHQYQIGGDYSALDPNNITIDAGSPDRQEECEGAGNIWHDGVSEYNQDGPGSPIIVPTGSGSSYKLTSAAEGVLFDIDATGVPRQVAWTEANSEMAFLAIDKDGDGAITSGKERFGNFTLPGASNGFEALRRMNLQTNGGVPRGSVSTSDPLFARLLLRTDANHNGVSEASELRPAGALLSDIGLAYEIHTRRDGNGNLFRYRGWVHIRTSPDRNQAATPQEDEARRRYVYDVFLSVL
jgi:hypothetical protein